MEFIFETIYNQKSISVMAEVLRKTIRKKNSKRSHIYAILVILLGIILSFSQGTEEFKITFKFIITWLVIVVMVIVLLFEDKINGYIARKRMITGMEKSTTTFKEDSYITETNIGKTEFYYKNINILAETDDYFVFVFDQSHAQIYDKNGITKGSIDEFRKFIIQKTEKEIEKV